MKRLAAAFVLSAAAGYAIARFGGGGRSSEAPSQDLPPVFAVGGLVPPGDLSGAAGVLDGLAARHCRDGGDFSVPRDQVSAYLPWAAANIATLYCPDENAVTRETLRGFQGRCDDGRVDLYLQVGQRSIDALAGCVAAVGAEGLTPLDPDDGMTAAEEGDRVRAVFRAGPRVYAWIERDARDESAAADVILPVDGK